MTPVRLNSIRYGRTFAASEIPDLPVAQFREAVVRAFKRGARLLALTGQPEQGGGVRLTAVLAPGDGAVAAASTRVEKSFPSLTPDVPAAHLFEREIF